MKVCPKCYRSHLALQVALGIGHDHKTSICDDCAIPESNDHKLIAETIRDGLIEIEIDLSGYGGLVDTLDSKPSGLGREGSTPSSRTIEEDDEEINKMLMEYLAS